MSFNFRCRQGAGDTAGVEAGTVDVAVAIEARIVAVTRGAHMKVVAAAAVEVAIPHTIMTPATITAAVTDIHQLVTELTIHIRNPIDL